MSRWLRINEDCIDNPKILKLPEALRWQWVALLCVASKNDGVLPPIDDVALCLRVPEAKAAEFITKLVKARLLDRQGDVFVPHNWDKRQFKSDSSYDRVKKYRDKRRDAGLPQMGDYSSFRPALIERDGERCVYCEIVTGLVVDHMVPITLGGTDDTNNLALACKSCNSGKAGRTPEMANMPVRVTSALDALTRYRDINNGVTVTLTAPEQSINRADSEQSRADASAPIDEDLKRKVAALQAGISAHFLSRQQPIPNLDRCLLWLTQGYGSGTVLAAVELVLKRGKPISTLEYFDGAVRDQHAKAPAASTELQVVSQRVFVEVGTLAWTCWCQWHRDNKRAPPIQRDTKVENIIKTGWWFDSEYPPGYDEATGERIAPSEQESAA